MTHKLFAIAALVVSVSVSVGLTSQAVAQGKYKLHSFEKKCLSKDFYSEGASFGDLNDDAHAGGRRV